MITVYGQPPTRALRVIWMLEEMGVPYEVRSVDFAARAEDAEFIDANPVGSFPALRDGDVTMMESCAILEYLGGRYGPTPLAPTPNNPSYSAYLTFLHFGEASLAGPMNVIIATRFYAPETQKRHWGVGYAVDNFVRKSAALRRRLDESPYLAGPDFTAADISCGYAIGFARSLGVGESLDPVLADYLDRLVARPAYKRAAVAGTMQIRT
jgi:glutathione S-transferase